MKTRLVLAIVGVTAAAVALFALPLAVALERSYRDEELLRLQRDTVAATRGIDLSRKSRDQIELPPFHGAIGIYSRDGSRLAGSGTLAADQTTRRALEGHEPTGSAPDGQLVVAVPLLNGEQITGAVRSQRSQAIVLRRAHRAWLALVGLGGVIVALAVVAAWALGRRLATPLERLAAAARRVGEGDFAAHASTTGIAEIDDVASALNSSSRRLGDLVTRERAFTANASHQLRTPLAALRLELESAELASPESPSVLSAAIAQVDRLEGTIETLLAVARDTSTGERHVELRQAISELGIRWHGLLAAQGRPLHTVVEVEHAVAAISPAVLAEITDVLIENAQTHGAGAISVVVRRAGDALAVDVSDQGPGFGVTPDAAFERVPEDGHGIGLALARSLAHFQGARLQITQPGPSPTVSLLIASA